MKSPGKIRLGVIGIGKMGRLHLDKFLALSGRCEVAGIYDKGADKTEAVAREVGVRAFASLEETLFESDAVVIASPTPTHYLIARKALEGGLHVLLEKPITLNADEAAELVELARERAVVFQVGHVERIRYLALARGFSLSRPRFIECHRLSPSLGREPQLDVISDLMIHDLDLALSLVAEEPSQVSVFGMNVVTGLTDMANVRLEFPSGAVVNLSASRVSTKTSRKFRVLSSDAQASFDFMKNTVTLQYRGADGGVDSRTEQLEGLDALGEQARLFLDSIAHGTPPVVSGRDGYLAIKCAVDIQEKIRQRARVLPSPGAENGLNLGLTS